MPFAISLPGQTSSATVSNPVSLVDLMPTALEICGNITPPYAMAGRSLAPLLVAPSTPWNHPVLITRNQFDYAIRQTRWRYIRYANGDRELYNLASDPQEWTNLAGDPSLRAVMKRLDALMPPLPAG